MRGFTELRKPQVVRSIRIAGSIPHFVRAIPKWFFAASQIHLSLRSASLSKNREIAGRMVKGTLAYGIMVKHHIMTGLVLAALREPTDACTVVTDVITGRPARYVKNALIEDLVASELRPVAFPGQYSLTAPLGGTGDGSLPHCLPVNPRHSPATRLPARWSILLRKRHHSACAFLPVPSLLLIFDCHIHSPACRFPLCQKANLRASSQYVRCTLVSGRRWELPTCPFRARSRHGKRLFDHLVGA